MLDCSSVQISVCMFIVSKALLIWSAAVIVRAESAIWLCPFATVLFNVCSTFTVGCCVLFIRKKALLRCLCNYCEEG